MGAGKAREWAREERRTEVARLLKKGWTERQMAAELEVPKSTIHEDVEFIATELVEARIADAEKARALAADKLAVAERAVIQVLETASDVDPELALKATDRLVRIHERLAKMYGTDAPEKIDATLTEGPSPEAAARLVREAFQTEETHEAGHRGGRPGDAPGPADGDAG